MADYERPNVEDILYKKGLGTTTQNVNDASARSPYGTLDDVIGRSFYGINHRQQPLPVPINKDYFGLTFFTRPQLNLSSDNLRAERLLTPLLSKDSTSLQRIIRCSLDHRLESNNISSPLVDNRQAFIPLLTNNLLSISGWPDVTLPIFTSEPGVYGEVFAQADGVTANYSTYNIQANFRNLPGDPVTLLFFYWLHYASLVFEGVLIPYPEKIIENEIDYMTRIYRLVLDPTKTFVKKIAACGVSIPESAPIGASFNYEAGKPINESSDQVSIPFRCLGAIYMDDILIKNFNDTTILFNPTMADRPRPDLYVKISPLLLSYFNNTGYPRINPDTRELEWWIDRVIYDSALPMLREQENLVGRSQR